MASKVQSTKFPPDLAEIAALRAKATGYRSWNAYLKGLVRYDALVQGEHSITLPVSELPPAEQDAFDAKLLEITKRGKGERGQLLKRLIERASGKPEEIGAAVKYEPGEE